MAPAPLTPINEESLPNFAATDKPKPNETKANTLNVPEDRGCLFFYSSPEVKGAFFDDSFFKDAQKSYQEAVQSVLNRYGNKQSGGGEDAPNMCSYRNLRQTNIQQDTQASGLSEQKDKYQIVLDVRDYSPENICVKAVGDQELLIEGKHVEKKADGVEVNQSFSRRFRLPGLVKLDAVTSALSTDGVLTVTAPKLQTTEKPSVDANANAKSACMERPTVDNLAKSACMERPTVDNLAQEMSRSNLFKDDFFNASQKRYDDRMKNFFNDDLGLDNRMKSRLEFSNTFNDGMALGGKEVKVCSDIIEDEQNYKMSVDSCGYDPKDISVKTVGDQEILIEGRRAEKNEEGIEVNKSFSRTFHLPGPVKIEEVVSTMSTKGILTVTAPKTKNNNITNGNVKHQSSSSTMSSDSRLQSSSPSIKRTGKQESGHTTPERNSFGDLFSNNSQSSLLNQNGSRFQENYLDDFFGKDFLTDNSINFNRRRPNAFMDDSRRGYQDMMQNMMNRDWGMDDMRHKFYSDMPQQNGLAKNEDTKCSPDVIESDGDYKMKLDVSKYNPQDISVKAVGDQDLLVEGRRVEKKAGCPEMTQSFSRRFRLPGPVKLEAVTSSLSTDGVLTVTAPKLLC